MPNPDDVLETILSLLDTPTLLRLARVAILTEASATALTVVAEVEHRILAGATLDPATYAVADTYADRLSPRPARGDYGTLPLDECGTVDAPPLDPWHTFGPATLSPREEG